MIRSLVIEKRKKKKEKDVKKKTKEIKKLKDEKHAMQMVDGVKDRHDEKVRENNVELEQVKTTVAEEEACTEMVNKEECDKATEKEKCKNRINMMKVNYDQALIDSNNNKKVKFLC